jgi:hypothetical protein
MKTIIVNLIFLVNLMGCSNHLHPKRGISEPDLTKSVIRNNDSIIPVLSANFFSKDSILITTTFFNNSKSDFYLFKGLIPKEEFLKVDAFGLTVEDVAQIDQPKISLRNPKQIQKAEDSLIEPYFPFTISGLKRDDFIVLPANDSVKFTMNIARFYDFQAIMNMNKKYRNFSVCYAVCTPLVSDRFEIIYEKERKTDSLKPVFIFVAMPDTKNEKYLTKRLYFSVEEK